MSEDGLKEVIAEFHVRAFGEELARVNLGPREERWAYVHRLWRRIRRKRREEATDHAESPFGEDTRPG